MGSPGLEVLRARRRGVLDAMQRARKFMRTPTIAEEVGRSTGVVRRDLRRMEDAGLVRYDEVYRGWRLADRLVVCCGCRAPYDQHRLGLTVDGFAWHCPRPRPKKARKKK